MYFKRCGQLTSNYNCFSGSYLIGVKTSEEAMAEGVDYCRPVNTSHNFFLPSYVRKLYERVAVRILYSYGGYYKSSC